MTSVWAHHGFMMKTARVQRTYDHRLKDLVRATGNIRTAVDLGVPESTARGWLQSSDDVVALSITSDSAVGELQREVESLRERNKRLVESAAQSRRPDGTA